MKNPEGAQIAHDEEKVAEQVAREHAELATSASMCACGRSPEGYALPTDRAQWGAWEQWHGEHVAQEEVAAQERAAIETIASRLDESGRLTAQGAAALRAKTMRLVRAGLEDAAGGRKKAPAGVGIESVSRPEDSSPDEIYLEIDGQNVVVTVEIL